MLDFTRSMPSKTRQRGAFSILTAFTLLTLLLFLVLVLDSGRLYMQQRQLQKVADMAALEAISRLPLGNCSIAPADADHYARENARERHDFLQEADSDTAQQNLNVACVRVDTGADNLRRAQLDEAGPAVQVTASHMVPSSLILQLSTLFSGHVDTIELRAVAVAEREAATASFSVGAQLLRLDNDHLVGQLLKGVGLNAQHLTVLDSDGLANARITPAGLLEALGVEIGIHELKALSPKGILELEKTNISLLRLIEIMELSADVVSDSILAADLDLLHQGVLHNPILRDINLQLFGTETDPGLLRLTSSPDGTVGAALDTAVNLGDLLGAGLLIGAHDTNRALDLDVSALGAARAELGIVEPPSIGIGPVGTVAYNAQVRLYVDVDTNNLLNGALAWLTNTVLGTRINLPIWIDIVSGQGTLDAINCETAEPTADIHVETDILNACVGKIPEDKKWSTSASCEVNLQDDELIRLLHIPVLSGKTHIVGVEHNQDLLDMAIGETRSTDYNKLPLGDTVDNLVAGLLDLLSGLFRQPDSDDPDLEYSQAAQNQLIARMATQYLDATKDSAGFYNVNAVTDLILNGSEQRDVEGKQVLPPLVDTDWTVPNSIPRSCLITTCPTSTWQDGTFSEAFKAYSLPHGLLDVLGLSTLGDGYRACGGLLSALLDWNNCVENNLTKLLQRKPGGINLNANTDGHNLANPNTSQIACAGVLCGLLKPVLSLVKPILNSIGHLLSIVLAEVVGIELGRTDVTVHSISCGTPRLVR